MLTQLETWIKDARRAMREWKKRVGYGQDEVRTTAARLEQMLETRGESPFTWPQGDATALAYDPIGVAWEPHVKPRWACKTPPTMDPVLPPLTPLPEVDTRVADSSLASIDFPSPVKHQDLDLLLEGPHDLGFDDTFSFSREEATSTRYAAHLTQSPYSRAAAPSRRC